MSVCLRPASHSSNGSTNCVSLGRGYQLKYNGFMWLISQQTQNVPLMFPNVLKIS